MRNNRDYMVVIAVMICFMVLYFQLADRGPEEIEAATPTEYTQTSRSNTSQPAVVDRGMSEAIDEINVKTNNRYESGSYYYNMEKYDEESQIIVLTLNRRPLGNQRNKGHEIHRYTYNLDSKILLEED